MAQEHRYIGKATPRVDAEEIVTGKAVFIDDLKLPNMLHGKVLRSPYPHANIKNIDIGRALEFPGVKTVLTHENAPDWVAGYPRHIRVLDSKVRCVGDAVALVAAETEAIAEEALALIDIEYEQLPAVYDVQEAMEPGAPQLYPEFPGNIAPRGFPFFGPTCLQEIVIGDVEKGFKEADFVTEGTYSYENTPNPLPPEPPGAIARWEGPDKLTLWSSNQGPFTVRDTMAPAMGYPEIQSIALQCGGSYGSKGCPILPIFFAAALAKAAGRGIPVKVVYTKEEHFAIYMTRFGSRIHASVGIKKDGTVTAFAGDWFINPGCRTDTTQGEVAVGLGEAQLMLKCANWNLQPHVVFTNRVASGPIRGFGGQELKSAFLPILTLAMEKADIDPVDFFKRNFAKDGDGYYWRDANWWECRGVDYSKAIEKGAETFGWKDKWKGWGKPTSINGTKRTGVGCGVHGNADAGEDRSEAYVRLYPHGSVALHLCVAEAGMGQRSSLIKMVAEVLNLPLDRISMTPPDTLTNPFDFGHGGSRGTYAMGSAATRAAGDARQKLFEMAAPLLGRGPEDLDTENGFVHLKDNPHKKIRWQEAMGGRDRTITGFGAFEPDFSVPNFFMTFVEVEVDIETGEAKLLRVTGATDVGQIISPLSLEGQIHASLGSAGTDSALFEETVLDRKTGHILNCNMIDYKWRTFPELPEFQNVILETPLPTHVFKAVGVGEITTSPGPSSVLMAVSNAISKRVTGYPATPDRILKALGKI
jgi:xanthine dehydrogenase molybdenum-binding subunit